MSIDFLKEINHIFGSVIEAKKPTSLMDDNEICLKCEKQLDHNECNKFSHVDALKSYGFFCYFCAEQIESSEIYSQFWRRVL